MSENAGKKSDDETSHDGISNDEKNNFEDPTMDNPRISSVKICVITIAVILLEGFLRTFFEIDLFGMMLSLADYLYEFFGGVVTTTYDFVHTRIESFDRIFGFFNRF